MIQFFNNLKSIYVLIVSDRKLGFMYEYHPWPMFDYNKNMWISTYLPNFTCACNFTVPIERGIPFWEPGNNTVK